MLGEVWLLGHLKGDGYPLLQAFIFIIGLNETILKDTNLMFRLLFIKTISIDALVCILIDLIKL